MKITPTVLSIPPYLSTTWRNISSLHVREEKGALTLIVTLQTKAQIEVPGLEKPEVDSIFDAHTRYTDAQSSLIAKNDLGNLLDSPFSFSFPLKSDGPLDSLGPGMQHDPEQSNLPPMPPEVVKKIAAVARAFGIDDAVELPKPEPHCNCAYCQISRELHASTPEALADDGEEVTLEDLRFRNWEIQQTAEKLYLVANPLDPNEHYSVFLGDPLGCTCGQKNCEHIRAVLNS